jgi:hypothetical protein
LELHHHLLTNDGLHPTLKRFSGSFVSGLERSTPRRATPETTVAEELMLKPSKSQIDFPATEG